MLPSGVFNIVTFNIATKNGDLPEENTVTTHPQIDPQTRMASRKVEKMCVSLGTKIIEPY